MVSVTRTLNANIVLVGWIACGGAVQLAMPSRSECCDFIALLSFCSSGRWSRQCPIKNPFCLNLMFVIIFHKRINRLSTIASYCADFRLQCNNVFYGTFYHQLGVTLCTPVVIPLYCVFVVLWALLLETTLF